IQISMTVTQFNVLMALASHPGTVLTRSQLIDAVYDDPAGHDIYDRTIDAHIKGIRKLIEDDPAQPHYIQTVIGRGYCFRELA
ncbi:MAG: winged helix-turn-helix domain-containing protein, partial [Candidatus Micrarchaeaceae archaeon]